MSQGQFWRSGRFWCGLRLGLIASGVAVGLGLLVVEMLVSDRQPEMEDSATRMMSWMFAGGSVVFLPCAVLICAAFATLDPQRGTWRGPGLATPIVSFRDVPQMMILGVCFLLGWGIVGGVVRTRLGRWDEALSLLAVIAAMFAGVVAGAMMSRRVFPELYHDRLDDEAESESLRHSDSPVTHTAKRQADSSAISASGILGSRRALANGTSGRRGEAWGWLVLRVALIALGVAIVFPWSLGGYQRTQVGGVSGHAEGTNGLSASPCSASTRVVLAGGAGITGLVTALGLATLSSIAQKGTGRARQWRTPGLLTPITDAGDVPQWFFLAALPQVSAGLVLLTSMATFAVLLLGNGVGMLVGCYLVRLTAAQAYAGGTQAHGQNSA